MSEKTATERAHRAILQLVRKRRYDEAIALCEAHIAAWSGKEQGEAWHQLAYVRLMMGNGASAIDAITRAIELAPDDPSHRDARADWALDLKQYAIVIEDCRALVEIESNRGSAAFVDSAHAMRAFALVQCGRLSEANDELRGVKGDGPFRIWHRDWTKSQLMTLAAAQSESS